MVKNRSDQADREIGETEISPAAARAFVSVMLVALFALALVEFRAAWKKSIGAWSGWGDARGILAANAALRASMQAFENRLREEAWLTRVLVPPLQRFKVSHLQLGTESVLIGREGWLHYAPDVAFLAGRKRQATLARAEEAIRDFAAQLAARGIKLVLVPVPAKTAHAPWTLTPHLNRQVIMPDLRAWLDTLESENLYVFDFGVVLEYLRADTHWTFEMMDWTASALSHVLRAIEDLPPVELRYGRDVEVVSDIGDLARMLGSGLPESLRTPQAQRIEPVRDGDFAWQPQSGSPVLLLGDSFSNIYSQEGLGWGAGAGFAEQLSFHLGFPIDRIVRNDAGAWATRDLLARDLARGRDRLEGVKVVVWQFAARELAHGDWRKIALRMGAPRASRLAAPPPAPAVWTGVVAAVSAIPTPGRVPYADHIAAFHLVEVAGEKVGADEAYVFAWSMTNHQRTVAGRLRPGDRIRFSARDWRDVENQLDSVNRSELDADEFLQADMVWAEDIQYDKE